MTTRIVATSYDAAERPTAAGRQTIPHGSRAPRTLCPSRDKTRGQNRATHPSQPRRCDPPASISTQRQRRPASAAIRPIASSAAEAGSGMGIERAVASTSDNVFSGSGSI